ncbi:MAG: hypothetical protein R2781_11635 [Flavobacteriaceae bacterium]
MLQHPQAIWDGIRLFVDRGLTARVNTDYNDPNAWEPTHVSWNKEAFENP